MKRMLPATAEREEEEGGCPVSLPGEEVEDGRGGERAERGAGPCDGGEEEQLPRPLLHCLPGGLLCLEP